VELQDFPNQGGGECTLLEPQPPAEKARTVGDQEAYVQGISTRSSTHLVKAMEHEACISKSQVSRWVGVEDDRPARGEGPSSSAEEGDWPYLWLDELP